MIDKRYRATVKSKLGNEWLVDVRPGDSPSGSPSPVVMTTLANGFELSYKGSGDEFTQPLRGSEVTVIMVVNNADDKAFIEDIATEQDQTYVIELYRKDEGASTYSSYWTGYIWAETIEITYASYPYTAKIQASDSVARFKDFNGYVFNSNRVWGLFQQVFANYSPSGTIVQDENIVLNSGSTGALQKLRLGTTYTSGASGGGETNLWYNLMKTNSEAYPYYINTFHNRLKVITDWLSNWGCRVFLEEGYYKILEFRNQNVGSVDWAEHDADGVPTGSTTTENLTVNAGIIHRIMEGGKMFFKPPYKRSELTYINNISNPAVEATDTRVFTITDERNVKALEPSFGEIWSYKLGHSVSGVGTVTDVTSNIGNNTTSGPATLVEIYQDNMEWFYTLPQKYFNGTIYSKTLKFSNLLIIGSEKYVANSLTLVGADDTWTGEWVKVGDQAETEWLSQNTDDNIQNQNNNDDFIFQ